MSAREEAHDEGAATLLRRGEEPEPVSGVRFDLSVIEGPDRGSRLTIDATAPSPRLVGQSHVCDLRLADKHVSRRHVAFDVEKHRLRIQDLGSTNGTFVDGVLIKDGYCHPGAIVRLGDTALRVDRAENGGIPSLPPTTRFAKLLGRSAAMRRLYPLCERLAAATVPVLLEGETGTGKEVMAESLHEAGPRASKPFVVFDCTTVPANLLEAELFGAERGAYTGASAQRKGVFELADGGTLFIDEIGDLDISMQPKLLRAIERREIRRIGGDRMIRVDVRVLSATRRNLDEEVKAGRFRDDLFHRLVVARIELPPLRARRADIPFLVRHFVEEMGGEQTAISQACMEAWQAEHWPGNVRELRNAVSARIALGDLARQFGARSEPEGAASLQPVVSGADLFKKVLDAGFELREARRQVVLEFERAYLARALASHGTVAEAARAAGVEKRYFQLMRARLLRGDEGSE